MLSPQAVRAPQEVFMADEQELWYTPERIDRILKEWPAYESQAQGYRASLPDALRPSHGPVVSGNVGACVLADVARAMLAVVEVDSLEWRVLEGRTRCLTFRAIADQLRIPKSTAHETYQRTVLRMAIFLGWEEPSPDSSTSEDPVLQ